MHELTLAPIIHIMDYYADEITLEDGTTVEVKRDMRTWLQVFSITNIPYSVFRAPFKFMTASKQPPELVIVFGPSGKHYTHNVNPNNSALTSVGSWRHVYAEFNDNGKWLGGKAEPNGFNSGIWIPEPEDGMNAKDAAHLALIQVEKEITGSTTWREWRRQAYNFSNEQAKEFSIEVLKEISRLRVADEVEHSAMTMIANENKERYAEVLEAAQIERALSSGWFMPRSIS